MVLNIIKEVQKWGNNYLTRYSMWSVVLTASAVVLKLTFLIPRHHFNFCEYLEQNVRSIQLKEQQLGYYSSHWSFELAKI